MEVSALTTSLPANLSDSIEQLASMGFQWIDVPPTAADRPARQVIQERKLKIGCVGLEHEQPEMLNLAAAEIHTRNESLAYYGEAIERSADLGADVAYLTPPRATDTETRTRWCDALVSLANKARSLDVQLCIEHFPNRLVPTARSTLDLLAELDQEGLMLLVDIGHCLISKEDPSEVLRLAGKRLGYVHFDDNDGRDDLHWGLLQGCLTEADIQAVVKTLIDVQYRRTVCLEFKATTDSVANLREGKSLLERVARTQACAAADSTGNRRKQDDGQS